MLLVCLHCQHSPLLLLLLLLQLLLLQLLHLAGQVKTTVNNCTLRSGIHCIRAFYTRLGAPSLAP
jgi:hypothetical protein